MSIASPRPAGSTHGAAASVSGTMQPFDLDKAEQAERTAGLQRWQLQRAMQVFQMRRDPNGSLLGILVELGYLDRDFALRLRNAPAAPPPASSSGDGDFIAPSMSSSSASGSGDALAGSRR